MNSTSKKRRHKRARAMLSSFLPKDQVETLMRQLDWKQLEQLTQVASNITGRSVYSW